MRLYDATSPIGLSKIKPLSDRSKLTPKTRRYTRRASSAALPV